jgi:hypothetical protein
VVLPCATVIILAELFLVSKQHKTDEISRVPQFHELPKIRWSAVTALVVGCSTGILTAGIIPGIEFMHVGVPALQAWGTALILYLVLRRFDR